MTPNEMLDMIAKVDQPMNMNFHEGPFTIRVGPDDAAAANLIRWLESYLGPEARIKDLMLVIDNAKWWLTTFATMKDAQKGEDT